MSGHRYLADTNTLIFLLDKHPALESPIPSDLPLLTFDKGFTQITALDIVLLEP